MGTTFNMVIYTSCGIFIFETHEQQWVVGSWIPPSIFSSFLLAMASRSSKGILKKPRRRPPSVTSNSSNSSWLARIQSRFYASTDFHTVPALTRQELKRVTFAVCDFKTEHILEQVDHATDSNSKDDDDDDDDDFGELYKQACRLVEEPPLECFMNLLQQSFPRYVWYITPLYIHQLGNSCK